MATAVIEQTTLPSNALGASRVTMPILFSWLSRHKGQLSAYLSRVQAPYGCRTTSYAIGTVTLVYCVGMGTCVSHLTARAAPVDTTAWAQRTRFR